MNDERLVRDIWKQLPHREVVGHRLTRQVGGRAWERFRFGRFRRFFERCGLPDPWDPEAGEVQIGLGEVGVLGARKTVAPHAAPPGTKAAAKSPVPPFAQRTEPKEPPAGGKPAPRIGEVRKDDTEILRQKSLEKEKKKVDPTRANQYRVNQPVARLPTRPDMPTDGPVAPPVRPARPPAPGADGGRPPMRPPAAVPVRPSSASPIRPFRMPVEAARPVALPDGPEEIVDVPPPVAARPGGDRAYAGFGLDGGWDDEPPERPVRAEAAPVSPAAPPAAVAPPLNAPAAAASPPAAPPRPPAPAAAAPRPPAPAAAPPPAPARPLAPASTVPAAAPPRPPAPSVPPAAPPRPPLPSVGPPKAAPPPRAAKPGGGGGLDDLFGMGGGGGGDTRVRMPKREDADPSKPRRPMVTPDADLGKGGVDRRPPPARPPSVTPTGGGASAPDPEGDGGE